MEKVFVKFLFSSAAEEFILAQIILVRQRCVRESVYVSCMFSCRHWSRLLKDLRPPQSFTPPVAGHFEARLQGLSSLSCHMNISFLLGSKFLRPSLTQFELHTNSCVTSNPLHEGVKRIEAELVLDFRNEEYILYIVSQIIRLMYFNVGLN